MVFADYPGHVWAAVLVCGFAGLVYLLSRIGRGKRVGLFYLSCGLYVLCAIGLLLLLWDPSGRIYLRGDGEREVAVVFDVSGSMGAGFGGQSRLERAAECFEEYFYEEYPLVNWRLYSFDESFRVESDLGQLEPGGDDTDYSVMLRNAAGLLSGVGDGLRKADAVVVFTDGAGGGKRAASFGDYDFGQRLFLVGVGGEKDWADVSIVNFECPEKVFVDSMFSVSADLRAENFRGAVKVNLFREDVLVDTRAVEFDGEVGRSEVYFNLLAEREGEKEFVLRVDAAGDEFDVDDNVKRFFVRAVPAEGVKVLLYARRLNFDIGKISSVLEGFGNVELVRRLDVFDYEGCFYDSESRLRAGFAWGFENLAEFDFLIISLADCALLDDGQVENVRRFAVERPGGVVFLGHENSGSNLADSGFGRLLPIRFGEGQAVNGSAEISLSERGRGFFGGELPTNLGSDLRLSFADVSLADSGEVLIEKGGVPLICFQRVGAGKVYFVNTKQLYKWYSNDRAGGLLGVVMKGILGNAAVAGDKGGVEFEVSRLGGGEFEVVAAVCDANGGLVEGAVVIAEAGGEAKILFEEQKGIYAGVFEYEKGQALGVSVSARKDDIYVGGLSRKFFFNEVNGELDNAGADMEFLGRVCREVNGRYFSAVDISEAEIGSVFELQSGGRVLLVSVWREWWIFLVLTGLLMVNWYMRKRFWSA